jgi:hypothetical protein
MGCERRVSDREMRLEAQKAESSMAAAVTDPTLCGCTVGSMKNATAYMFQFLRVSFLSIIVVMTYALLQSLQFK